MSEAPAAVPTLEVEGIHTYYGESHILRGVSLTLPQGRVVGVLGRNGSGKSTLVKSVVGFVPVRSGTIKVYGRNVERKIRRPCGTSAAPWRTTR